VQQQPRAVAVDLGEFGDRAIRRELLARAAVQVPSVRTIGKRLGTPMVSGA